MAPEVAVAVSGQTAAQAKVGSAQPNLSHSVNVTTSKGKGKIIPRQGAKSRALVVAKTPLISENDLLNGECIDYPKARFLARLKAAWVAPTRFEEACQLHQARFLIRAGSPVKLSGAPLVLDLMKSWGLHYLTGVMAHDHMWDILGSTQKHNSFTATDMDKNIFGSYYHVREPKTRQLQMTFQEYAQCAKHWTTNKVLFKNTVMQCQERQGATHKPDPLPRLPPVLAQQLQSGIRWDWLQALQRLVGFGPAAKVTLEVGSYDSLMPAQYQTHERLLAQVTGSQRILLIPAEHAFDGMYPYPQHHPYDTYSMVDLEHPDLSQWPRNANVKGLCCIVKPGDALYLPAYWFVHAQQLEESNISLTFHMDMGLRPRPPACIPLQLSRHLESRVAQVEGPANVRHWLRLIAYCEEEDWIDLATVKGYRRIVMCQEVRDELDVNPTKHDSVQEEEQDDAQEEEWQRILIAMCDGRLLPTPWLNQDFWEPLYLTDTATQIEDLRSAEERKYPQLFRQKLEGDLTTCCLYIGAVTHLLRGLHYSHCVEAGLCNPCCVTAVHIKFLTIVPFGVGLKYISKVSTQ